MALAFAAAVFTVPAPRCDARLVLSPVEQKLIEWFQPSDPGIRYYQDLQALLSADELVARRLLLSGCDKRDLYRGPDRLANDSYRELVREVALALKLTLSDQMRADGLLEDDSIAALVFSFRKADDASRRAWLDYLQTGAAREGRDWAYKIRIVEGFKREFAFDASSRAEHASWLHWLAEYLRRAGLYEAFVKAADEAGPQLGRQFANFVSAPPPQPAGGDYHARLKQLGEALGAGLPSIAARLWNFVPAEAARLAGRWSSDPMLQRVAEVRAQMALPRPDKPVPRPDPDLGPFLRDALGGEDAANRIIDRSTDVVRIHVAGKCALLRTAPQ